MSSTRYVIAGRRPPWNLDVYLKGPKTDTLGGGFDWQVGTADGVPHFSTATEASRWAADIGVKDFVPVPWTVVLP